MKNRFVIHGTVISVLCASCFLIFHTLALGQEAIGPVLPVDVQTVHPYVGLPLIAAVVQTFTIGELEAKFILLHFTDFSIAPGDEVWVMDKNGRISETLTSTNEPEFWTLPVFSDTVKIQLLAQAGNSAYGFRIDKLAIANIPMCCPGSPPCPQSTYICSTYVLGKSVALVGWVADSLRACTGWIYKQENYLVTCYHCVPGCPPYPQWVNSAFAAFDFNCTTYCPEPATVTRLTNIVQCRKFLDFSVLAMQDPPGRPPLDTSRVYPSPGDRVYMIHHSGGCEKQLSEGTVTAVQYHINTICGHYSDIRTNVLRKGGASGAPVLNSANKVIALHHAGDSACVISSYEVPILAIAAAGPGCDTTGVCCVSHRCIDTLDRASCLAQGGTYVGDWTNCRAVSCPTLTQWALITLVVLIMLSACLVLRRRKVVVSKR